MRSWHGGLRRRSSGAHALAVAGSLACVAPACRSVFTGPYPCADGFASCTNPQANRCETDLTSDAQNCGACGKTCTLGAACTASQCGAGAMQLAQISGQGPIAINSTDVFFFDGNAVERVSIDGGSPTIVGSEASSCSGAPFAVDDSRLYYWSQTSAPGLSPGLTEVSLSNLVGMTLVPDGPTSGSCSATAVDATNVYWLSSIPQNGPQAASLWEVPIAGGSPSMLGQAQGYGTAGLAITGADAIVAVNSNNGPQSYAAVPLAGGPPAPITVNLNTQSGSAFTADATNVYFVGSGCPCGGNGPSYQGAPTGQVVELPIAGGQATILAQVTGEATGIAIDATNVYWSTDSAVWKVPIAGGAAVEIAGGLASSGGPFLCAGNCGGSPSPNPTTSVAVDSTSVYIADFALNTLLKVPK